MALRQIVKLEPSLKAHVLAEGFSSAWSVVLQSRLTAIQDILGDDDPPHVGQMKYIRFIEKGGVIILVTDGWQLVGVATIGHNIGLRHVSLMVEDIAVAAQISLFRDRVFEAILKGIGGLADSIAQRERMPTRVHLVAASSDRKALRRILAASGFNEEKNAPTVWTRSNAMALMVLWARNPAKLLRAA